MIRPAIVAAALFGASVLPAAAQDHTGHHMPGMEMPPATPAPAPTHGDHVPAPTTDGMDHSAHQPGPMDHSAHAAHAAPPMQRSGTALPAGDAPAPPVPHDHYADRDYPGAEMERARAQMMRENGGQTFALVMFNIAEYQARRGGDGYRWDGEAWFGGDINRVTLKSEGEGTFGDRIESAELQALYSRAIGPYFNLQAGLRHDFEPGRPTTYATLGFEGLAPYWFEVEGAAFLSDRGDLLARLEGYYDQRLTQRLVLQPRVEANLSAQDVPETRTGAGLSSAEVGLRLRYEISRRFAPYVGVNHEARLGRSARYAREDGDAPNSTSLVAGVRLWF